MSAGRNLFSDTKKIEIGGYQIPEPDGEAGEYSPDLLRVILDRLLRHVVTEEISLATFATGLAKIGLSPTQALRFTLHKNYDFKAHAALMELGADINASTQDGTVLHEFIDKINIAQGNSHLENLSTLLDFFLGCAPNLEVENQLGRTAFGCFLDMHRFDVNIMMKFLQAKADIHTRNQHNESLIGVITRKVNDLNTVTLALEEALKFGGSIHNINDDGDNALQCLMRYGNITAPNGYMLVEKDNTLVNSTYRSVNCRTFLHLIAVADIRNCDSVVRTYTPLLLQAGADPTLVDVDGHTVAFYLSRKHHTIPLLQVLENTHARTKPIDPVLDLTGFGLTDAILKEVVEFFSTRNLPIKRLVLTNNPQLTPASTFSLKELLTYNIQPMGVDELMPDTTQAERIVAIKVRIFKALQEKKLDETLVAGIKEISKLDADHGKECFLLFSKMIAEQVKITSDTPTQKFMEEFFQYKKITEELKSYDRSVKDFIAKYLMQRCELGEAAEFIYYSYKDDEDTKEKLRQLAATEAEIKVEKKFFGTFREVKPAIAARYFQLVSEYSFTPHEEGMEKFAALAVINPGQYKKLQEKVRVSLAVGNARTGVTQVREFSGYGL